MLVALAQGPQAALHVLLRYFGIQPVEGYVLQPLLTNLMQVVLGRVGRLAAVAVAGPLTAVLVLPVRRVYAEDVLGDRLGDRAADA